MLSKIKDKEFVNPVYRKQPLLRYGCFVSSLFKDNFWLATYSMKDSLKHLKYAGNTVMWEKEDWYAFMRRFEQRFEKDISRFDDIFENCYFIGKEVIDESKRLKELHFKSISTRHMLFRFHSFMERWNYLMCFIIGVYPMESFLTKRTREEFIKHIKRRCQGEIDSADKYLEFLLHPSKKNFVNEEPEKLLEILAQIQEKGILSKLSPKKKVLNKRLHEHFEKYRWLTTRHFWGEPRKKGDFVERVQRILKQDCKKLILQNRLRELNYCKDVDALIKKLELNQNPRLMKLIEISREMIYFRTFRTDATHVSAFNIRPLLNEIASRFGYGYEEIINMTVNEIVNLPNERVSRRALREWIDSYGVLVVDSKPIILHGKKLQKLKRPLEKNGKGYNIAEIKGGIAFGGRARGRVRIILDSKAASKFRDGEILVTNMTTPDLITAMQKAAAFVTDEGGLTCHAAIIAREMKKPCVTGTNIATKVLKDGDLIEVDADNGVVKKL